MTNFHILPIVSHMVIEEVNCIQNHLEIEKTCRESAEALASKVRSTVFLFHLISFLFFFLKLLLCACPMYVFA